MRLGPQGRGAEGENQPQSTGRNHEANWKQREQFQTALEQEVKTCTEGHERTSSLPDVSFFHGKETTESLQFVNQDKRDEGLERWPREKCLLHKQENLSSTSRYPWESGA